MWVAKFKLWHKSPFLEVTSRHPSVKVYVYYLNMFEEGSRNLVNKAALVEGEAAEEAMDEIARDPRITVFFRKGNQMLYTISALASFHSSVLSRTVFFLGPLVAEKGFEWWTLASTRKQDLLDVARRINSLKGKASIELLSLKRGNPDLFAHGALAGLTALQRKALLEAFRSGYYDYPRKTDVKKMARRLGVPRTTLTEHLRKAEARVMPLVLGEYS